MLRNPLYRIMFWLLLLLPLSTQARDELVFSTIAEANPYTTEALFTPLVNYLSRMTGKPIVLDVSSNVVEHAVRMRLNKFDIVFDDAHFAAWRMEKKGHVPLVRGQGDYRIAVVMDAASALQSVEQLQSGHQRICALDSPAMSTMAFLAHFPNPTWQPFLIHARDDADALDCLRRGRGDLAVVEAATWEVMDKQGLKLLPLADKVYPQRTITAGPRVDPQTREALRSALLSDEGQRLSRDILRAIGSATWVRAEPAEYQGISSLLNSVWGFY